MKIGSTLRFHAHWLDGEYRIASSRISTASMWSDVDNEAERLIKTFALFGGSIVLSDVQIVDSPVLWKQFSQPAFLKFLRQNSDFLQLKARPVTRHSDSKWSVVMAGLERAIRANFIASPMKDKSSVITLSKAILAVGPLGDFKALAAKSRLWPDAEALLGFLNCVEFLASSASQVVQLEGEKPSHTFYSILESAVTRPALPEPDREKLRAIIQFVDQAVENPEDRIRRAVVRRYVDFSNPFHVSYWRTIIQAWNVALQRSIDEREGSIGQMLGSVPIAAYVDVPVDVMLRPSDENPSVGSRLSAVIPEIPFSWNPGDMSWTDLLRLTENTAVGDARSELQAACTQSDDQHIAEAVQGLARAVAPNVKGRLKSPVRPWMWILGGAAVVFGGLDAQAFRMALPFAKVGESAIVAAVNKVRDRIIAARVVDSAKQLRITA